YDVVRNDIKAILPQKGWDDGSIGPILVRLAWHTSGTYDKTTKTGGSDGATMRYSIEANDPANAGLEHARAFLEPIKEKHSWISLVSIEAMGGPTIPWKHGRKDKPESASPPNGRLPDAEKGASHIREVFYRDRSGYERGWTFTETRFNNQFYVMLTRLDWQEEKLPNGLIQYGNKKLMMLPSDMAFLHDPQFSEIVKIYANNKETFFEDFAAAFGKLLELGVNREEDEAKL
ncbi:7469_t:CDS:2, partial [Scutellospora calospora]